MTDILSRPEWHTTTEGPAAELTELRRRLAEAELRAANADERALRSAQREDTAQFAFDTAKTRADRAEAALRSLLIERIMPRLPEALENSAEAIADCLIDDIAAGTPLGELNLNGHIESWMEERR